MEPEISAHSNQDDCRATERRKGGYTAAVWHVQAGQKVQQSEGEQPELDLL